jgi:hypothetical protein
MKILNSYRIELRSEAKRTLEKLHNVYGRILIIHYSCESFYGKAGYTPRITGIAILNRENNESIIFSIHLSAQILHKNLEDIKDKDFDEIEKHMLDEFNKFVINHSNYIWIHWRMRSASYGFQAISNRYRILGGQEISINDINKVDLPEVFGKLFTYGYETNEPNGQLLNLAKRNNISTRDALTGAEEAAAFDNRDYLKLHMSTLRKIEIIDRLLATYQYGKLKHNARLSNIYDLSIPGIITLIKESPLLLAIVSIIAFVLGVILEPIIKNIFGINP